MKFSDYLQFLHKYLGSDKTHADFVLYITELFLKEPSTQAEIIEDESDQYNPLSAYSKRTLEKIYSSEGNYKLARDKARKLSAKYDPSKFYTEMLNSLSDSVITTLIAELKLLNILAKRNNYEKKCADIYYAFLKNLAEGKDSIEDLIENHSNIDLQSSQTSDANQASQHPSEAISFCKRHENELMLIPLCSVADNIAKIRHNIRMLYDDYSLCTEETKKAICQLSGTDYIEFKKNWIHKCIDLFEEDVKKYHLGEKEFLYDGAKYLHCALEFADKTIDDPDPYVFRPLSANSKINSSLTLYIKEYMSCPNDNSSYPKPIDMVWEEMNLAICPLEEMTFWVMRMIISSIYQLPSDVNKESAFVEEFYLETYEDFYYYTLYILYYRYMDQII